MSSDPLGPLKAGESRQVAGSGTTTYTIKRVDDYYQCTCPSFVYQYNLQWKCRTCKHIEALRGKDKEKVRTDKAKKEFGTQYPQKQIIFDRKVAADLGPLKDGI